VFVARARWQGAGETTVKGKRDLLAAPVTNFRSRSIHNKQPNPEGHTDLIEIGHRQHALQY
jgi:hypothetical protein